jgi:hypothetical protein
MSGGSYDYKYHTIDQYYNGKMYDELLNAMVTDFVELLHDLEWWQSSDYSEEIYREHAKRFKEKWFGNPTQQLLENTLKALNAAAENIKEYLTEAEEESNDT